jgi:CRP/FNR family transcriptional regulator, cyclic AMP receptor protein
VRKEYGFETSRLPAAALGDFDAVQSISAYPKGTLLFTEKQDSRGIFMLCEGQVKLSVSSSEGKTLILRIVKAGEALGLMAVLSRSRYEATAETCRSCQVAFIRRDDFLRFVAHHPEAYPGIVRQLSASYGGACDQLRNIGLQTSVHQRVCRLLLHWAAESKEIKRENEISLPLTHAEIGELIGASRETITRTFSRLRDHHLIVLKGRTLTISSPFALERLAADSCSQFPTAEPSSTGLRF